MDFVSMLDTVDVMCHQLMDMDEAQFMVIMCQLFDEYHARHQDSNSAEMARQVADMVETVNEEYGEFEG